MSNLIKAKSWKDRFQCRETVHGGPPHIEWLEVASGETILDGDPIVLSSGKAAEGAANSGALYGVAGADGDAGDMIPVYVADTENIFEGQADAATSTVTKGLTCDIVGSGTNWLVDIGASVEDVIQVLGCVPGDDTSDSTTPGRVKFIIIRSEYLSLLAAQ